MAAKRQRMVTVRVPLSGAPVVRCALSAVLEMERTFLGELSRDETGLTLQLARVAGELGHAIEAAKAKADAAAKRGTQ